MSIPPVSRNDVPAFWGDEIYQNFDPVASKKQGLLFTRDVLEEPLLTFDPKETKKAASLEEDSLLDRIYHWFVGKPSYPMVEAAVPEKINYSSTPQLEAPYASQLAEMMKQTNKYAAISLEDINEADERKIQRYSFMLILAIDDQGKIQLCSNMEHIKKKNLTLKELNFSQLKLDEELAKGNRLSAVVFVAQKVAAAGAVAGLVVGAVFFAAPSIAPLGVLAGGAGPLFAQAASEALWATVQMTLAIASASQGVNTLASARMESQRKGLEAEGYLLQTEQDGIQFETKKALKNCQTIMDTHSENLKILRDLLEKWEECKKLGLNIGA